MSNPGRRIYHNVANSAWTRQDDLAPRTNITPQHDQGSKRRRSSINMLLRSGLGESAVKEEESENQYPSCNFWNTAHRGKENLYPGMSRKPLMHAEMDRLVLDYSAEKKQDC